MGPRPSKNHTLDRIDNDNPNYGPELCRWATKQEQATNRGTTHFVHVGGERLSVSEASRRTGRTRSEVSEVALGQYAQFGRDPRTYQPWPHREDDLIFNKYERQYLLSGGIERWNRYEFLIAFCQARIKAIWDHSTFEIDDNEEQYLEGDDLNLSSKWQEHLKRAQQEFPIWLGAVDIFNAQRYERELNRPRATMRRNYDTGDK